MPQSDSTSTDQLARLVEEKHACLVQLRDLGARQQELIERGEMTQLLRLLGSKHQLIAALQRIEAELAPFRGQDPEARVWRSPETRAACASRVAASRELLDAVVNLEKSNESLMLARQQSVADRLHQVHAAERASGAYRMHARGRVKADSATALGSEMPQRTSVQTPVEAAAMTNGLDLTSDIR